MPKDLEGAICVEAAFSGMEETFSVRSLGVLAKLISTSISLNTLLSPFKNDETVASRVPDASVGKNQRLGKQDLEMKHRESCLFHIPG